MSTELVSLTITDGDHFELIVQELEPIELAIPEQLVIIGNGGIQAPGVVASLPAAATLSGHRVLIYANGSVNYADNLTLAHAYMVLGVSQAAAGSGTQVDVYNRCIITESTWTWVPGDLVFCGANGLLTQIAPVSPAKFLLVVGTAIEPTKLAVDIQQPILI